MTRKVYIVAKLKLIIDIEDGVEVSDFMDELEIIANYPFEYGTILDERIFDYEVMDSK